LAHRIRLESAWRVISKTPEGVLWRRVFHCPTGLSQDTDVWLVIEGNQELKWLRLNGSLLFENREPRGNQDSFPLRRQIRTYLMPGKNVLEVMFMPEKQFLEGPLMQESATPLRVIPIEICLEIQEGDTVE